MARSSISDTLKQLAIQGDAPKSVAKKVKLDYIKIDPNNTPGGMESQDLTKSMLKFLNGGHNKEESLVRLAFESDPTERNNNGGLYEMKLRLIPDDVLKRIAIQDDLIAAIVNARSNMLSAFGRRQPNRFSTGFRIVPMPGVLDKIEDPEVKKKFLRDIELAERKLSTCGTTDKWGTEERYMTFSQYLYMTTRNAVVNGRIATEIIYTKDATSGERKFQAFRPLDVGTIFRAVKDSDQELETVRKQAIKLMEYYNKEKIPVNQTNIPQSFDWVQVIRGKVMQVFNDDECAVHNFYPVTDIELNGYPITPIDTVITQVITHINIGEHNKLYFQSGRAARGMLILESDAIDDDTIASVKQQFNASINSVQNAWRMPVFGINPGDKISWTPIDTGSRDMEFQFLSDSNARAILSAFLMSPDELPGYTHLSRGTNSQSLSEADSEYKLTAARDVGLRPLISQMEDFINARLFPLIDSDLAKICTIKLVGLDALTEEKESVRLSEDSVIHMTMDEILGKVEKEPLGLEAGGSVPFNEKWWANLLQFRTKGWILERFFGIKDASKDPRWDYCLGDPVDSALFQGRAQAQLEMQMQQQAAQQQLAAGQPADSGEIQNGLGQVQDALGKSERLPAAVRRLVQKQDLIVKTTMDEWEKDAKKLAVETRSIINKFKSKKNKIDG